MLVNSKVIFLTTSMYCLYMVGIFWGKKDSVSRALYVHALPFLCGTTQICTHLQHAIKEAGIPSLHEAG
jgi:hypothetical protein